MDLKHKYQGSGRPIFFKSMSAQVEVDVNSREVQGYLAAFNNRDEDGDFILPGAFAKSLRERGPGSSTARKIAYLWNHDLNQPLGVFTELYEDSKGLAFKGILDETEIARNTLIRYQSGSVNNHSVGHKYIWDKIEVEEDAKGIATFYLKEINLFEGSATPLGVNENTPYTGKKSLGDDSAILSNDTELFLKSLSPEMEYKGRQLIAKHIALTEAGQPPKALETKEEPRKSGLFASIGKQL